MYDFRLTDITLSLDGQALSDSDFNIVKTLKTVSINGSSPKDISDQTKVPLSDGVHMITYTVEAKQDKYGELSNRKYTCSQTVTIISHKCKPLVIEDVDMLNAIKGDIEIKNQNVCLSKSDNAPVFPRGDAPIFGTSTSVVCKGGKNFQAYVGDKTLD